VFGAKDHNRTPPPRCDLPSGDETILSTNTHLRRQEILQRIGSSAPPWLGRS
jgi:hypothetical protein